jgi:hypothetical protein
LSRGWSAVVHDAGRVGSRRGGGSVVTVPGVEFVETVIAVAVLQGSDFVSNLPEPIQNLVESAPPLQSSEGLAVYGSGGMMTVGGVLKIYGRFKSSSPATASAPTAAGTVVTTAKGGTPPGIKNDKTAFTLPGFLPVSKGIRKVSHNEVHALELGAVLGFVVMWLYSVGRQNVAAGLTILFVAGALGFERYKSKAIATVRMEPWYAFVAFAIGAGGAYGVFLA